MAGIGFELKELFQKESYTSRMKAYMYSTLVAAGPWIVSVLIVNVLLLLSKLHFSDLGQRDLFMGTIVYSFVFSQIATAPWQLLITRYLSDRLYAREYASVRPSFQGVTVVVFIGCFVFGWAYYSGKDLPLLYKHMAFSLFAILSMTWILMVYLTAIKNYVIISKAYITGGAVSVGLSYVLMNHPLPFLQFKDAANLLLSYLVGFGVIYCILLYSFLSVFPYSNGKKYDFIRYLTGYKSLFFTGLFYVLGLWIDDLLMWYSMLGVDVYGTYRYAPLYDNAIFLAYLTIIPTMVLFMVTVETEFYDTYRTYYGLAAGGGTYKMLAEAGDTMRKSLSRQLLYALETQTIITLLLVILSGKIFSFLGYPVLVKEIFRIASLGALCNIFVLIVMLVLLYFEARSEALAISFLFFSSNLFFTEWFIPFGVSYYGVGYFAGSFLTLMASMGLLLLHLRSLEHKTFAKQPVFYKEKIGFSTILADWLNRNT